MPLTLNPHRPRRRATRALLASGLGGKISGFPGIICSVTAWPNISQKIYLEFRASGLDSCVCDLGSGKPLSRWHIEGCTLNKTLTTETGSGLLVVPGLMQSHTELEWPTTAVRPLKEHLCSGLTVIGGAGECFLRAVGGKRGGGR